MLETSEILLLMYYLRFDSWWTTCNSNAIWFTFSRAPDLIQSSKPPLENSYSSISIWRFVKKNIKLYLIFFYTFNFILPSSNQYKYFCDHFQQWFEIMVWDFLRIQHLFWNTECFVLFSLEHRLCDHRQIFGNLLREAFRKGGKGAP